MSSLALLDELDTELSNKIENANNIVEQRKKILDELDETQKNDLDFIDKAFLNGDLSKQAYIKERINLLQSYRDPRGEQPQDALDYQSIIQDLGFLDGQISNKEYVEKRITLLQEYIKIDKEDQLPEPDKKLVKEAYAPEEYIKEKKRVLDKLFNIKQVLVPDAKATIIAQRLLFLVALVFGVFFIMLPGYTYFYKLSTVSYFTVIAGGLYEYYFTKTKSSDYEPYVSIIIPVYNGESDIYDVIKSHVETEYPHDKLEILIANDGSKDRTVSEVHRTIMDFPDVYIRHLKYPKNGGKRSVIKKAFDEATGEVIVRCDADTFVDKSSLRLLVSQLEDPAIGGVTGFTKVNNWRDNLLTRIQKVRYDYAFQQQYSFHNLLGDVYCLPGCFSAYRRDAIAPVITQWGLTRPTLSEDRHMAHLLLEKGFKTRFVKEAVCYTNVPKTWKSYIKQQYRWGKANALQQLRATTFMYGQSLRVFSYYALTYFVTLTTPFLIARLLMLQFNWVFWLTVVSISALARGVISEGFNLSAIYAVPLFYSHLIIDSVKTPFGMLTLSEKD